MTPRLLARSAPLPSWGAELVAPGTYAGSLFCVGVTASAAAQPIIVPGDMAVSAFAIAWLCLPASIPRLSSDGVFLLENGVELLLWVGQAANPSILTALFGLSSLEGQDLSSLQIQVGNEIFLGFVTGGGERWGREITGSRSYQFFLTVLLVNAVLGWSVP